MSQGATQVAWDFLQNIYSLCWGADPDLDAENVLHGDGSWSPASGGGLEPLFATFFPTGEGAGTSAPDDTLTTASFAGCTIVDSANWTPVFSSGFSIPETGVWQITVFPTVPGVGFANVNIVIDETAIDQTGNIPTKGTGGVTGTFPTNPHLTWTGTLIEDQKVNLSYKQKSGGSVTVQDAITMNRISTSDATDPVWPLS